LIDEKRISPEKPRHSVTWVVDIDRFRPKIGEYDRCACLLRRADDDQQHRGSGGQKQLPESGDNFHFLPRFSSDQNYTFVLVHWANIAVKKIKCSFFLGAGKGCP
jgi:hypothetical protein